MNKKLLLAVIGLFVACNALASNKYRVDNLPPAVIKTYPVAGDTSVSPSVKEIRVTFSKDMMTKEQWSWVIFSKDTFPKISGKVKFIDKRTCVAPVKLESGKTYAIWFNHNKYDNFKDVQNHPAIPYLLVFQTK
jgi:Bacterial Ig-like domain